MYQEERDGTEEREPLPFWKSCLYALFWLALIIGLLFGTCLLLVN